MKKVTKKVMIAAACAVIGFSAFAVMTPEVYELTINLQTMTCKAGKGVNACDEGYTTYRQKSSQKITGLFWGCDCPTIAEPKPFETFDTFGHQNECHGYVFWDASDKTKPPYQTATFTWTDATGEYENFLQCVNPKCSQVEGVWTLRLDGYRATDCEDPFSEQEIAPVVFLQGAGIGQSKWNNDHMAAYINNMSGNVTGWVFPGSLTGGCIACGEAQVGCSAWKFCTECEESDCNYPSIAYGTWTLKFNAAASKKYGNSSSRTAILDAYRFSEKVKQYLIEVDAQEPEPTVDDCTEAQIQLAELEAELVALESKESGLKQDLAKYNKIVSDCTAKAPGLQTAYDEAVAANEDAQQSVTGLYWSVEYVNASRLPASLDGKGCESFLTDTPVLKAFTLIKIKTSYNSWMIFDTDTWWNWTDAENYVNGLVKTAAEASAKVTSTKQAIADNDREAQIAKQGIASSTEALAVIPNQKQQLNAQIGAQRVVVHHYCD